MSSALDTLRKRFGHREFRPLQGEAIEALLAGRDVFLLMPTGGGKSLCYQLPALLMRGTAVVASPLVALMKDQVDALEGLGVAAAAYNSSLDGAAARRVLARLHAGELDLVYVAPERLVSAEFLARLDGLELALFAIDEAHCVSQWGHDFRPEYRQLDVLGQRYPGVPRIALTATADPHTREDVAAQLGLAEPLFLAGGFDRPNIRYRVVPKSRPVDQLLELTAGQPEASGIVYCLTRRRTEEVAAALAEAGLQAGAYHAGLTAVERRRVQERFLTGDLRTVVATVAFGMGIDKPDVRYVVHHDLPLSVEAYYQETGRAGRDGLPAEALLLYAPGDAGRAFALIERGRNHEQQRIERFKLRAMMAYAEGASCRRQALLHYFGEEAPAACGNCDVCLDPPETVDATEEARMALSCVFRVGQRFGAQYVVDVLVGSTKERLQANGHDKLPTWGVGRHHPRERWVALLRQLVHAGYLEQDLSRYAVLKLTDRAGPLLRGEETLRLALPRHVGRPRTAGRSGTSGSAGQRRSLAGDPGRASRREERPLSAAEEELFEELRSLRRRLAAEQGVPAYVVFNDRTLRELARRRPGSPGELLDVPGVGPAKLDRYGAVFLEALSDSSKGPASGQALAPEQPSLIGDADVRSQQPPRQ